MHAFSLNFLIFSSTRKVKPEKLTTFIMNPSAEFLQESFYFPSFDDRM